MKNSAIEWTHHTFNPWIGCTKVSPGCKNCYAAAQDNRWGHDRWGVGKPRERTTPAYWRKPLTWDLEARHAGERHRVFCASLKMMLEPTWRVGFRPSKFWKGAGTILFAKAVDRG